MGLVRLCWNTQARSPLRPSQPPRLPAHLQQLDFPHGDLPHHRVFLAFQELLDGDDLPTLLVPAFGHHPVAAFPHEAQHLVLLHGRRFPPAGDRGTGEAPLGRGRGGLKGPGPHAPLPDGGGPGPKAPSPGQRPAVRPSRTARPGRAAVREGGRAGATGSTGKRSAAPLQRKKESGLAAVREAGRKAVSEAGLPRYGVRLSRRRGCGSLPVAVCGLRPCQREPARFIRLLFATGPTSCAFVPAP